MSRVDREGLVVKRTWGTLDVIDLEASYTTGSVGVGVLSVEFLE